jgi:RNA recognition motif-containing protein
MPVKLFVGGLAFSTATDRLREAFARFGSVTSAAVMNDRETGRSRGFGFVEMATPEEADKAISGLNGTSLDGRTIRVDKATPRGSTPPRPAGGPGGNRAPYQDRRPPMGGGGGGFGQRYSDRGGSSAPAPFDPRQGGGFGQPSRRGGGGGGRPPAGDQQGQRRRSGSGNRGEWRGGEGRRTTGRPKPDENRGTGRGRPSAGGDEGYRWGR